MSIYVPLSPSPSDVLASLQSLYTTNPLLSTYLDVHLVISPNPRQFNLQRNLARFFARTEFVMMLDVDFVIRTSFRERITGHGGDELRQLLRGGQAALVLPAMEYTNQEDGMDPALFPEDKEVSPSSTRLCVLQGGVTDLLCSFRLIRNYFASSSPASSTRFTTSGSPVTPVSQPCLHEFSYPSKTEATPHLLTSRPGTNYTQFYSTPSDSLYRVSYDHHGYEPYVVFPRVGPPYCEERFVGYGGNKAACLYQMHLSGIEYYVLGGEWVIHRSHAYAEKTRTHEVS